MKLLIIEVANNYGVTVVRKVEVNHNNIKGAIEISYFYPNKDLTEIPKITTIIPKIYQYKNYENSIY